MAKITIEVEVKDLIVVTENHGGYLVGMCFACKASGWLYNHGYPARAQNVPGAHLQHRASCPMNDMLNDDGSFKIVSGK